MGYRCFEVEVTAKVAHVTMSRPDEYNSMVREFWTELPAIARELDARGDVRAMVLSSTGKHFTAGMDLGVFSGDALGGGDAEVGRVRARLRQTALMLQDTFTALEKTRFPVLVAVQGGCIGGGVDLVCAADMRYAIAAPRCRGRCTEYRPVLYSRMSRALVWLVRPVAPARTSRY